MKRILLIVFILLVAGCSKEVEQEPLQQLGASNEEPPDNELKKAYSIKKVRISPLNNLGKGKTIDQLLEENLYMKKVYGEIYEIYNELELVKFIEQKLLERDNLIGVKYLGQEMPAKLIEDAYESLRYKNDIINSRFIDYEYGIEQIKDGYFIDFRNSFIAVGKSQEKSASREVDKMYSSLQPQLEGLSDYEKIKKIYQFVMDHMNYTVSGTYNDHSVVGFAEGRGVCQAYAIGLYTLLTKAGFEARYLYGSLHTNYQNGFPNHVWNMVKLEGQWYHLDATWDDEQEDWLYFLVSDLRVEASRSWNKEYYEEVKRHYTGS